MNHSIGTMIGFISESGGYSYLEDTNDHRWKRLFITTPDGVTVGKVLFLYGKFFNIKNYKKDYHRNFDETDMIFGRLYRLMYGHTPFDEEEIMKVWKDAEDFCILDLERKKRWRKENPRPVKFKNGRITNARAKLKGRNPRHIFYEMIHERFPRLERD